MMALEEKLGITKVIWIYCLSNMNACTKYLNLSN